MNKIKQIYRRDKVAILLAINLMISVLLSVIFMFSDLRNIKHIFIGNYIFSNCIGFTIFTALNILDYLKINKYLRLILVFVSIIIASFIGGYFGSIIVESLLGWEVNFFHSSTLIMLVLLSFLFGLSAYILFILINLNRKKTFQLIEEQRARTEAELISLRNRLNPHFLFNTLNSVAGLIYIEPEKAEMMIQMLSELLRYNLDVSKKKKISLDTEIKAIYDYLNIEKIRFEKRLVYSIENNVNDLQIPPFIILNLVENSIKHGVSKEKNGGEISVRVFKEADKVIVRVFNTCSMFHKPVVYGFGLSSILEILKINYGDNANFIFSKIKDGVEARIEIKNGDIK